MCFKNIRAWIVLTGVTLGLVGLLIGTSWTGQKGTWSVRCESGKLVKVGDSVMTVLRNCGEPTFVTEAGSVSSGDIKGTSKTTWTGNKAKTKFKAGVDSGTVNVEKWHYDMGPGKFPVTMTIRGGKVVFMEYENK